MMTVMSTMTPSSTVLLRRATIDDLQPLVRLAQLDSRRLPKGPYLVAEDDGRLLAAVVIASDDAFADPFAPTAAAIELLRARAAQLRAVDRPAYRPWVGLRAQFPAFRSS
jgi:hypothetical protein